VGIDDNATSTAITIDASENTFIAKTAIGIGTVGHELRADGLHRATRAGSYPLELNRTTSYGDQIRFDKDGTVSGSIVSHAPSEFGISSEQTLVLTQKVSAERNLVFGASYFGPFDVDNGAINLGRSNAKFKDLHLSGNVVVASGKGIDFSATSDGSGTMTSEVLDDYETGTWTPTNGTFSTWTTPTFDATYTKIGRLVTASFRQTGGTIAAAAAGYTIFGLPYAPRIASTYGGSVSNSSNAELGFANVHTNSSFYFTRTINAQTVMSYTVTYETA
jgi:hypothetical protein